MIISFEDRFGWLVAKRRCEAIAISLAAQILEEAPS
jgi:hypothetical protein